MSSFNYTIAIDAMGGENSPKKVIDGINISLQYYLLIQNYKLTRL